jgi:hypothetical protein
MSYIVKQIRQKLVTGNAILAQADKGKTMVIITLNAYTDKVHTFLSTNNLPTMPTDPTKKYHNLIQKNLQECNLLIDKHKVKYLIQKKPTPPALKARIKLHKQDNPIRPVVDNMNAPSYKAAKHLIHILNTHLNLKNTYNVTQSTQLATELSRLSITGNQRLITYDIKDLYINIPINEVIQIIHNSLGCQTHHDTTTQIIKLTKTILSQNYFMFQNKIHHTNKGVAMGSPISNTIAGIFVQHYENTYIKQALDMQYIQYYTRYVDDILIIYDNNKITHEQITQQLNQLHTDLTF